jgi:streptomycin 3"-adenylyltransferase
MPEHSEQISAALAATKDLLGDALIAFYLHGSAATGRLRPQSDIDLLAIVDRPLRVDQRDALLAGLLRLSGRHPARPNGPRCLELMVFSQADLASAVHPVRAEFVYGEWLREAFERGEKPTSTHDPEYTMLLAQARRDAKPLAGPNRAETLPEVSRSAVQQAMRDLLPKLIGGLRGDERNVLLTLARMWRTASVGDFVSKDEAAAWAIPRLGPQEGSTLDFARRAYLGAVMDDWNTRQDAARRLADRLQRHVITATAT